MGDHHHSIRRHSIHLGTAWEPPKAIALGHVVWTRRFGRPEGLGPDERVLLAFAKSAVAADVVLNDARLPPLSADAERWEQDVTPLLRARNELVLTLSSAAGDDELPDPRQRGRGPLPSSVGRVTLEIVVADRGAERRRRA